MFQMLGVFAEFERAIIRERVPAGMARARAKGTKSGKPIPTGVRLKELQACISRAMEASSKVELAIVE